MGSAGSLTVSAPNELWERIGAKLFCEERRTLRSSIAAWTNNRSNGNSRANIVRGLGSWLALGRRERKLVGELVGEELREGGNSAKPNHATLVRA